MPGWAPPTGAAGVQAARSSVPIAHPQRTYDPNRLVVKEDAARLAMISPRKGRIYSRWDKIKGEALSPYARKTADMLFHGMPTNTSARVLMVGLGGGVIAGDLLCRDGALSDGTRISRLDVIELNQSVVDLASKRFFPVMFSKGCAPYRQKLSVIVGNALAVTSLVPRPIAYDGIAVDVPPAYDEPGGAPIEFWSSLLEVAAPGALMVVNTLYTTSTGTALLSARLEQAGWNALPAVPMSTRVKWRPHANMLMPARPRARHPRRRHGRGSFIIN